jgi:hypothetical protein
MKCIGKRVTHRNMCQYQQPSVKSDVLYVNICEGVYMKVTIMFVMVNILVILEKSWVVLLL